MSEWQAAPSFLRWDFLEKIAGSEISKIVGVIPIAGYLILFNDGLADAISFDKIAGITDETDGTFLLSSVTKLRLTFFGSILIFVSNILFRMCSPKALELSKSDFDFSDRVMSSYSVAEIRALEAQLSNRTWNFRTPLIVCNENFASFLNKKRLNGFRETIPRRDLLEPHQDYVSALSREWWIGQMHTLWLCRWLTLASCSIGYLMIAIPSCDIAQAVVRGLF